MTLAEVEAPQTPVDSGSGPNAKPISGLDAKLARLAPKVVVLLQETRSYARTMQFLEPHERRLVRRIRQDFLSGRSNVYTRITREAAPALETLLLHPPKVAPAASRDANEFFAHKNERAPAGEYIVTALERFQTGEIFLGTRSATLDERRVSVFVEMLPTEPAEGCKEVGTVGSAIRRLSHLAKSDYKPARLLGAREAKRLLTALEESVHVSARMECPIDVTMATPADMLRERARNMKAQGVRVKQIAKHLKRSESWVHEWTADVPGFQSLQLNARPLWPGLDEWLTRGIDRMKLAITEDDLDFARGMDAAMIVIGTLSKGSGLLSLESHDPHRLNIALNWLEAETSLERGMGILRLRVRDSAVASVESVQVAAAAVNMREAQVKRHLLFVGKTKASCDVADAGAGIVIEFLDHDVHEQIAGLQAAKREIRKLLKIVKRTVYVEQMMKTPEWVAQLKDWAGT